MIRRLIFFLFILILGFPINNFAASGHMFLPLDGRMMPEGWFGQLLVGFGFSAMATSQWVPTYAPLISYQYVGQRSMKSTNLWGVSVGYEIPSDNALLVRLGIHTAYVNYGTHTGTGQEYGQDIQNFTYQFSASSFYLLTQGQLVWQRETWRPLVILGAGVVWNHLDDYQQTPYQYFSLLIPNTKSDFAFELGVGIERSVSSMVLGLAYHYLNGGQGEFGPAKLQTSSARFKTGIISAHLIELSVLF